MNKQLFLLLSVLLTYQLTAAQHIISFPTAKFQTGDNPEWKNPEFNDEDWKEIRTNIEYESQGFPDYNGYSWYRIRFYLPSKLLESSYWKEKVLFYMSKIDDVDETYLNGHLIGKTGTMPYDAEGYETAYNVLRYYTLPVDHPAILWDAENVLAVKVYDGASGGGIYDDTPAVRVVDLIDQLTIKASSEQTPKGNQCVVRLQNNADEEQKGKLKIQLIDLETNKPISTSEKSIRVKSEYELTQPIPHPKSKQRTKIQISYLDEHTGKIKEQSLSLPYILTPPPALEPRINGAKVFGIRPGSPFLFKMAVSGEKPIQYEVKNLPQGLYVDAKTGIITGVLNEKGVYKMTFVATNSKGKSEREFTVKVGETIALTPPMGWNSWNCWGGSVTDAKVRSSAQALIDKGLIDYGWTYINVDDYWEADSRNNDGVLEGNANFPDMKGLGDWLHSKGLKYGIYSSPGKTTCGGNLASYKYEAIDAKTYTEWGVDYLKYDWCGYGSEVFEPENDKSLYAYMKPYFTMQKQLEAQNRDIIYSLCQYGMADVWQWGRAVGGHCWRTTGDIIDTRQSLRTIGFELQDGLYSYAGPGYWNDPDMLIVGKVGWGENLHPTRLTPDEQYTHISLWCLLAAPLLIGCDISQMDDFTLSLLTNSEVLEVNQDVLGKQGRKIKEDEAIQIWAKELEDGSHAIGFFNLGEEDTIYSIDFNDLGFNNIKEVRDLWRQKNLSTNTNLQTKIPTHGVFFCKIQ